MINLTLAKTLKRYEFPYRICHQYYSEDGSIHLLQDIAEKNKGINLSEIEGKYIPIPIIEDIIWALGDSLMSIGQPQPGVWGAIERSERPVLCEGAPTMEDALGSLWVGVKRKSEMIANQQENVG